MKKYKTRKPIDPVRRFWVKVDIRGPDECWLWMASLSGNGYGKFWLEGRSRQAHQLAYEYGTGKLIPEGMDTMHSCDTPACCNPSHLSPGTRRENLHDRDQKGRGLFGEHHHQAVLTEVQVREILKKYEFGRAQADLIREYNVSTGTIYGIVTRRTWRHLPNRIFRTRILT